MINKNFLKKIFKNIIEYFLDLFYFLGINSVFFILSIINLYLFIHNFLKDIFRKFIYNNFIKLKNKIKSFFKVIIFDLAIFFKKVKTFNELFKTRVIKEAYKENGVNDAYIKLKSILFEGINKNISHIMRGLNVIVPIFSFFIFISCIIYCINLNFVLNVEYNGKNVGYISNEKSYDKAKTDMLSQLLLDNKDVISNQKSFFSIAVASSSLVKSDDEFTRSLISASGEKIDSAFGLYKNGNFITASKVKDVIYNTLKYNIDKKKEENPDARVQYADDIKIIEGLYAVNSIAEDDEVKKIISSNVQENTYYKVQSGDTPLVIAAKNNISYEQLKRLNPSLTELIYPGMDLLLNNQKSLFPISVIKNQTYTTEVAYNVEEVKSSRYYEGYRKVTQKGENGVMQVTAEVNYIDGIEASRNIIQNNYIKNPVNEEVVVGTASKKTYKSSNNSYTYTGSGPVGSGKLAWPAGGGYLSNGYLGYYGHYGIDIAANYGTPIYAADDGVVVSSGWSSSGYGYNIVINHGNGMQTLYAHNSKNIVSPGQHVKKGQLIGYIGSTGNSTGNHVHFEVIVNGVKKNPMNYL